MSEYLEVTKDKFTFRVATHRRYAAVEARVRRELQAAQKYSLVASSIKSEVVVEPEIRVEAGLPPAQNGR